MTVPGGRPAAGSTVRRGRPWLVQVAALRRQPGSSRQVAVSAPIEELAVSNAWVPDGTEVAFEGRLEAAIGGLVVLGRVSAPWEGVCRRCLGTARGVLDIQVRELTSDEPDPELGYRVTADWLDLEPIVHDACILELPLAPLCREDCQGLCPRCGANRNSEPCSCEDVPADPRWAALAGLVDSDQVSGQQERRDRRDAGQDAAPQEGAGDRAEDR